MVAEDVEEVSDFVDINCNKWTFLQAAAVIAVDFVVDEVGYLFSRSFYIINLLL